MILQKSELQGGDAFEFMIGELQDEFWLDSSIYIIEEDFLRLHLDKLFESFIKDFNYYGPTTITQKQWVYLLNNYKNNNLFSKETEDILNEINKWAKEVFKTYSCFTICGL